MTKTQSAETAIAALAKRFWSIHPSTLDDMGLTREEFYASEMVKLFGALTRNEPQTSSMTAPRERYAMLYLHDWDPPKEGQEHRWEPGKNVFPEIHNVYETLREANAVLSSMSDPKKYWVRRVWVPAHDTSSMTRPQSNTVSAPRVPPQAAWQPVDTAPHEERVLLGWYQPDGTWFCETGMASHGWRRNGISNMSRHGAATHWQPLPSPLSRPQSNTGEAS